MSQLLLPAEDEIRWAEEIVAAWDASEREGRSVVVVNGRMIEYLHASEARRVLMRVGNHTR